MITKQQLASSIATECDIAVHLFGKLGPDSYDYRPSPGQRNTTELLQYLSMCGIGGIRWLEQGRPKVWKEHVAKAADLPPAKFVEAMQQQKAEIAEFFTRTDASVLATREATMPTGDKMPLGAAIMNGPLKWLTAYKLQLFLYAKATGATEIGTANAWAGIDWPAR